MYKTELFCNKHNFDFENRNLIDPLTLEPFTPETEYLYFKTGCGIASYDFNVFYKSIHKLNNYQIPHTREVFTLMHRKQFDEICHTYNREPIFVNVKKKDAFLFDVSNCQTEDDVYDLAEKYGYFPSNILFHLNSHIR